ncbi:MAG: hypothetical protein LBL94_10295 [Prevotellaceae bacterium]|nr:hypothetical protein [Prevotellaceae bacterium]
MVSYYQENIAACHEQLQAKRPRSRLYGAMRGVTFLCFLAASYFALTHQAWVCWLSVAFFAAAFVIFVRCSHNIDKKIGHLQALKNIYEQELASIVCQQYPNADGSAFRDPAHPYANDLDIFGDRSLFHLLNRCYTFNGRSYLAGLLQRPPEDAAHVYLRQEAIKELCASHRGLIFEALASLSVKKPHEASSGENIHSWIQQPDKFCLSKPALLLMHVAPTLNLTLLALAVYNPLFFAALLLFFIPQHIIQRRYSKHTRHAKNSLNVIVADVAGFDVYSSTLAEVSFRSSWLQPIQQHIAAYGQLTPQLQKMLSVFDMGDTFFGSLVKSFLHTSLRTAVKLEKWKKRNRAALPHLIEYICEWEALLSFAVFSMNHPTFTFPKILDEDSPTIVEAKELGHPLIAAEKRISNDVAISKNDFFIITGANMAGKSAFLRTVGINLLLARVGAPVCASFFHCTPTQLFTSMRTADNLDSGLSYFYAEALRFKKMLDFIAAERSVLLIVDELFRGTNSDDRLKASLAFIRKLAGYSSTSALIATHDLGVTALEKEYPEKIKSYCFECANHDDLLLFDYKLRRGVTRSSNAYLLLQKMHIIS